MSVERYLAGYPSSLRQQARALIESGEVAEYWSRRYPDPPEVHNDAGLYALAMDLKGRYVKRAPALSKVRFCDKISTLHAALGLHSYVSRVQGAKLKSKNELRVASLLKGTPPQILRAVVVHELAHLKEVAHNKAFYNLCQHMDPDYHQHEFDLRLYLAWQQAA